MTFVVSVLIGLVGLVLGGELLVRGSVAVARRLRVSPLLIGLTLVGFGTSTPELVTSLSASLAGSPGIAVGNVVGSNIANILLILGLAALVRPLAIPLSSLRRDGTAMLIATLACAAAIVWGELPRLVGLLFLAALAGYVISTYLHERRAHDASASMHEAEAKSVSATVDPPWLAIGMAAGGLVLTIFGARYLVDGAIGMSRAAGISETTIGLTVVAVGTSLPELVTSLLAAWRRQADIAFGNILGSNIFNALGILGGTALVTPIPIPPEIARLDVWVMLAATGLLVVFAASGRRLSRWEGGVFLAGYTGYVAYLLAAT